jgi:hypothetical protein
MKIGHICLATEENPDHAWFAALVEAIAGHAVEQHVLVASIELAKRLAGCTGVTVGPIVRSPALAYCLMPNVDIAHVHDGESGQAGLLLTLTRSIPFVLTEDQRTADDASPLARSVLNRAAFTMQYRTAKPAEMAANEYLAIYEETLSGRLKFPENADSGH